MGELLEARETAPGQWSAFAPGVYDAVPNEVYQESDGTSKSHLDDIAEPNCPLHYWAKRVDPKRAPSVKTPALILGDAMHKAILEPDLFDSNFVMLPEDAPQRPTAAMLNGKSPSASSQDRMSWWADWDANNVGKIALKNDDFLMVRRTRDAVHTHPTVKLNNLLVGGKPEQTFYAIDPETGALIKCRTDYELLERQGAIVDIKSTEDASAEGFARSVFKYRYDVQDAWYGHVIESAFQRQFQVRDFWFIAIEKTWPHAVGIWWIDPDDRPTALDVAKRDHRRILECRRTNEWPDFGNTPGKLRPLNRRRPLELA